jgi:ABC-type lipoprotein release transport system permease subunit
VLGLSIGGAGAWMAVGLLRSQLHDVTRTDGVVFLVTGTLLFAVTLLASVPPARAAGRADPLVMLRDI